MPQTLALPVSGILERATWHPYFLGLKDFRRLWIRLGVTELTSEWRLHVVCPWSVGGVVRTVVGCRRFETELVLRQTVWYDGQNEKADERIEFNCDAREGAQHKRQTRSKALEHAEVLECCCVIVVWWWRQSNQTCIHDQDESHNYYYYNAIEWDVVAHWLSR